MVSWGPIEIGAAAKIIYLSILFLLGIELLVSWLFISPCAFWRTVLRTILGVDWVIPGYIDNAML